MVKTDNIRSTVVKNLKEYLGCPLVRANQTAKMPAMPYGRYTITTLATANNGTYGEYEDGKARKPVKQHWSLTFESDKYEEAVNFANKARSWFEYTGTTVLNDNDVIVESVGAVGDRSNLLTIEYQYSYGFDVTFWAYDEVEILTTETIEELSFGEDYNQKLEDRLDGVKSYAYDGGQISEDEALNALLEKRLNGVD